LLHQRSFFRVVVRARSGNETAESRTKQANKQTNNNLFLFIIIIIIMETITATAVAATQQQQLQATPLVPGPIYIDTQHEDLVHDAQMDYYGVKLATCSSGKLCYVLLCCAQKW